MATDCPNKDCPTCHPPAELATAVCRHGLMREECRACVVADLEACMEAILRPMPAARSCADAEEAALAALADPAGALAAHDAAVRAEALREAEAVCRAKAAVISKRNDAFGIKHEQSESATLDCADAIAALAGKGAGG